MLHSYNSSYFLFRVQYAHRHSPHHSFVDRTWFTLKILIYWVWCSVMPLCTLTKKYCLFNNMLAESSGEHSTKSSIHTVPSCELNWNFKLFHNPQWLGSATSLKSKLGSFIWLHAAAGSMEKKADFTTFKTCLMYSSSTLCQSDPPFRVGIGVTSV